ncbi:hypothetical protein [Muribaculum intestinale]|uniref:hypothetical protein n=1 Tax=Muribaculum intestinale TaxID=1796646 RepID=UPI003F681AF9
MWWFFAIEYCTFNSQAAFNAELTADGFHQGGLGAGVTTLNSTKWNTWNGYNPFIPCGFTLSLGNKTGVVTSPCPTGTIQPQQPRLWSVCHLIAVVTNPFGHIWKWTDGCLCNIQSDADGGLSEFYVCDDPTHLPSTIGAEYQLRGNLPRKEGYVKALILGEHGEIMPLEVGGGSTTYFCDYFYTTSPQVVQQHAVFCSAVLRLMVRLRASCLRIRFIRRRLRMRISVLGFAFTQSKPPRKRKSFPESILSEF